MGTPDPGENNFDLIGRTGTYGRGDALIVLDNTTDPRTDSPINIGESYLECECDERVIRTGSGTGENSLGLTFDIVAGEILTIDFDAQPYLEVELDPCGLLPAHALAELDMSVTITDLAGNQIFSWEPNGDVDSIIGGTENSDDLDLNVEIFATENAPGPRYHNQILATGNFNAQTDPFAETGRYLLFATMNEDVDTLVTCVPEPSTVLLLGAGLIGLAVLNRKKFKK